MAAPGIVIRLGKKLTAFDDLCAPKIVGQINDMSLKAVKVQGEFVWHTRVDTDEFFLVRSGSLTIQMKDRRDAVWEPTEILAVPKGVEHRHASWNTSSPIGLGHV